MQIFEEQKNRNCRQSKGIGIPYAAALSYGNGDGGGGGTFRLLIFSEGNVLISGFDPAPNHQKKTIPGIGAYISFAHSGLDKAISK